MGQNSQSATIQSKCHSNETSLCWCTHELFAPSLPILHAFLLPLVHVDILKLSAVVAVLSNSRRISPASSLYKLRKDAPIHESINKIVSSNKLPNMKSSQFAIFITGVLGAVAMANPIADPEPNPVEVAPRAKYTINCDGGMVPDSRCTNGKKKDGCRCDSKGTYLCDPSSLAKSGGQCAKCGCREE